MILNTQLQNELSPRTTTSVYPEFRRFIANNPTSNAKVISIEAAYVYAPLPNGYAEISDLIKKRETNPRQAAALARARQRLTTKSDSEIVDLATLRLKAGLSQSSLAEKIGNSQPSYSNIEAGRTQIYFDTFEKLVNALNVSRDELAIAIKNTLGKATYRD